MTDKEVMQMALDALEKHVHEYEAIETLRTALAQPELGVTLTIAKHPVSLGIPSEYRLSKESLEDVVLERESTCAECDKKQSDGWALYCVDCLSEFYKHDPTNKREWVGLTDEDCAVIERWVEFKEAGSDRIATRKLIKYIETALREKYD